MKIVYFTSAADPDTWPKATKPEVALAGRSNAGKSSFLNSISGQKVAKVSQMPGKTRLLNFFEAGEKYRFVDMPGYGYSARSGDEQEAWGPLVESFIDTREALAGVLVFIDVKRDWGPDEQQVIDFAQSRGRRVAIVVTKVDQLNKKELRERDAQFKKRSRGVPYFFVSSTTKDDSTQKVEDFIFKEWIRTWKK